MFAEINDGNTTVRHGGLRSGESPPAPGIAPGPRNDGQSQLKALPGVVPADTTGWRNKSHNTVLSPLSLRLPLPDSQTIFTLTDPALSHFDFILISTSVLMRVKVGEVLPTPYAPRTVLNSAGRNGRATRRRDRSAEPTPPAKLRTTAPVRFKDRRREYTAQDVVVGV
ncbi:hypothetical protein Trydic_g9287 [Trypoxylus dichotomus]